MFQVVMRREKHQKKADSPKRSSNRTDRQESRRGIPTQLRRIMAAHAWESLAGNDSLLDADAGLESRAGENGAGSGVAIVQRMVNNVVQRTRTGRRGRRAPAPPALKFPNSIDDLLTLLPNITKVKDRSSGKVIYIGGTTRIRAEQHALQPGEIENPRHHGLHFHVEKLVKAGKSWNKRRNVTKLHPAGYVFGQGTGFIPGEDIPNLV